MLDAPRIVHIEAQDAAIIHVTVPREEIRTVMGPAMGEVVDAVTSQGIGPAGPMFSHHLRMHPDTFDLEVGVPVSGPVTAGGRVKPGQLPARSVARTVYQGPYEGLGAAWQEFNAWIAQKGLTPDTDLWERYLSGPESGSDPFAFRTELNRPIIEAGPVR